jgi:hypothetical protein
MVMPVGRRPATKPAHAEPAACDSHNPKLLAQGVNGRRVGGEASEQLSGIRLQSIPSSLLTVQLWALGDENMTNNDQEILRMATTR